MCSTKSKVKTEKLFYRTLQTAKWGRVANDISKANCPMSAIKIVKMVERSGHWRSAKPFSVEICTEFLREMFLAGVLSSR
jgi:hypothetical protein